MDIDMILDTAFLEEMIQDNSFSVIHRLVDTERTD
ncbi:spore germination protein [Peribacillus butanolivorans]